LVVDVSRKLVIFGTRQIAEVLGWYFAHDSDYEIVAYTVDAEFLAEGQFQGRPVVAFEEVAREFPPDSHAMFVALSYAKMNSIRAAKYAAAKALGYPLANHVSPRASAWEGLALGENSFVMEHNVVQPFSRVGSNTFLWAGNHIGHHAVIGDHCFLASHIVVSGATAVGDHCFIGVNATLRDGITIAPRCLIGAGALIMADTEPEQVFLAQATVASRVPSSRVRM
jgi:sugar O-acyltransferase (sialic acid O-acetyltransferase NeuD family)